MDRQTKLALKHSGKATRMQAQLEAWSTQLDRLIAGFVAAGAQGHDPYRVRVENMRSRQLSVQTKLNVYNTPPIALSAWGGFQASINEDWSALVAGFKDLSIDPSLASSKAAAEEITKPLPAVPAALLATASTLERNSPAPPATPAAMLAVHSTLEAAGSAAAAISPVAPRS